MSRWVLFCKQCRESFPHTEIGASLADYFLPVKPQFLAGGQDLECPKLQSYPQLLAGRP
jgi:hypothetical protein